MFQMGKEYDTLAVSENARQRTHRYGLPCSLSSLFSLILAGTCFNFLRIKNYFHVFQIKACTK